VTGITDVDDNLVVEYSYDAWGKLLNVADSSGDAHIGQKNPFLYRGYYYDSETGLYYLNSRYYDPQTGRFLNADDTSTLQASQGHLLSTNLFAYCVNNPIIYSDPNGNVFQFALAGAYGAYTAVAVEAGAANFWNPVGWTILGISAVATVAIISYSYYQSQQKPKPVNLPSYKTIKLDMGHILSGHGPNGSRGGPNKDRFPKWMTASSIAAAIREAYRYGELLQRQGDRVFIQDPWNGYSIQMWVNTVKKIIESAWPKY